MPEAAKKQTSAGAVAFAKFFVARLNSSWTQADDAILAPYCLMATGGCTTYLKTARELKQKGQRYAGDPLGVSKYTPLTATGGVERILLDATQNKVDVIDRAGKTVLSDPEDHFQFVVYLKWTSGWKVQETRAVGS